jgi:hypothetical protein
MANIRGEGTSTARGDAAGKVAEDEACERPRRSRSQIPWCWRSNIFAIYAKVLALEPQHFVCLNHLGLIAHHRGDHQGDRSGGAPSRSILISRKPTINKGAALEALA